MSDFAYAVMICGLTPAEAAEYLDEPTERVAAWCASEKAPPDVWASLADLHSHIVEAAAEGRDLVGAPEGARKASRALARMGNELVNEEMASLNLHDADD